MFISHLSKAVRFTGRWAIREDAAITTACGSMFELAFSGKDCVLRFDVKTNSFPYPRVYIQLDGGARTEAAIDHFVRVEAPDEGNHILKVVLKSAVEKVQRWHEPLVSKVSFVCAEADGEGVLPCDNRRVIEFIGDSITEGVWVDFDNVAVEDKTSPDNMVFQNDATATYAYLTAEALDMRPQIMGYGSVGLTKSGGGGVPRAFEAYPFAFAGNACELLPADVVVINHGTNDSKAPAEEYLKAYEEFLTLVRKTHPNAKIVALCAFMNVHNKQVCNMVDRYNAEHGDDVVCIDTDGWIPLYPIHPKREVHRIAAQKLAEELRRLMV